MNGFHVMDFIEEEIAERGWSLRELAVRMGGDVEANELSLLVLQERIGGIRLGAVTDAGLSRAFGTSPGFFMRLDGMYWDRQHDPLDATRGKA